VYNRDNRLKVARDEEAFEAKQAVLREASQRADAEARRQLLLSRARERNSVSVSIAFPHTLAHEPSHTPVCVHGNDNKPALLHLSRWGPRCMCPPRRTAAVHVLPSRASRTARVAMATRGRLWPSQGPRRRNPWSTSTSGGRTSRVQGTSKSRHGDTCAPTLSSQTPRQQMQAPGVPCFLIVTRGGATRKGIECDGASWSALLGVPLSRHPRIGLRISFGAVCE
jgi:hypothetical protein